MKSVLVPAPQVSAKVYRAEASRGSVVETGGIYHPYEAEAQRPHLGEFIQDQILEIASVGSATQVGVN